MGNFLPCVNGNERARPGAIEPVARTGVGTGGRTGGGDFVQRRSDTGDADGLEAVASSRPGLLPTPSGLPTIEEEGEDAEGDDGEGADADRPGVGGWPVSRYADTAERRPTDRANRDDQRGAEHNIFAEAIARPDAVPLSRAIEATAVASLSYGPAAVRSDHELMQSLREAIDTVQMLVSRMSQEALNAYQGLR